MLRTLLAGGQFWWLFKRAKGRVSISANQNVVSRGRDPDPAVAAKSGHSKVNSQKSTPKSQHHSSQWASHIVHLFLWYQAIINEYELLLISTTKIKIKTH
jgi:hypothetical protein